MDYRLIQPDPQNLDLIGEVWAMESLPDDSELMIHVHVAWLAYSHRLPLPAYLTTSRPLADIPLPLQGAAADDLATKDGKARVVVVAPPSTQRPVGDSWMDLGIATRQLPR